MENAFNQSLWGDEGFSAILSMKSLPEIISIISRDTSPPLWNICEWIVFQTLGREEIFIRGLSFFFYLMTAIFVYKIGAFLFSKKTGLLASILILLNPFFFTYAFEGRMYSIMSMGVAGSMFFFLRILYSEDLKKTDKIGYVFFTLWALYSHHFSFFSIIVQGIWWFYEFVFGRRVRAKKIFKLFLITGLLYTPWIHPLYLQTRQVASGFWLSKPNLNDLKNLVYDYLAEGIKRQSLKIPLIDIPLSKASLYVAFGVLIIRKWWRNIKKTIFFILWFFGPIILTWLISQKFQPIFFNRYLLYTIPAISLIFASSRSKLSLYLLSVLAFLFLIIDYNYFTHPSKPPFRTLSSYVKRTTKEGDFLINWYSNGTHHIWETKYYGIKAPIYLPQGDLPFFVGTALMTKEDIIHEIPKDYSRIGVITSGAIDEVRISGYTKKEEVEFENLKFIWMEKEK